VQFLAVVVLGIIAYLLVKKALDNKKDGQDALPVRAPVDLANLTVREARPGDVVSIVGAGDDFADLSFTVDRRDRFESGREEWYELSGLYKGKRVYVEWCDEDELEVYLDKGEKIHLDELGLTERDLERLDREESTANTVNFDGRQWRYAISREVGYFKNGRGNGEGFYSWEFSSPDDRERLSIEKYAGDPFEVGRSLRLDPTAVTVYRT
jgi:hypothetical protein